MLVVSDNSCIFEEHYENMSIFDARGKNFSGIDEVVNRWLKSSDNYYFIFESEEILISFLIGYLMNKFSIIHAAGGLIKHPKKGYLLIYKRGYWDVQKGKVDKGETTEQAAVRECMEETGITGLSIEKNLGLTFHVFEQNKKYVLKITQWYLMCTSDDKLPVPQAEEDIEKIEWISGLQELTDKGGNTYSSIKEVMKRAGL
jgi:ADP-ribose pyrophosphatase YjhB (NUDIX family)